MSNIHMAVMSAMPIYHWCIWQFDDKWILYLKWIVLIWVECPTLTLHRG